MGIEGEYNVDVVHRLKEELARKNKEMAKKDKTVVALEEKIAKLQLALQKQ